MDSHTFIENNYSADEWDDLASRYRISLRETNTWIISKDGEDERLVKITDNGRLFTIEQSLLGGE